MHHVNLINEIHKRIPLGCGILKVTSLVCYVTLLQIWCVCCRMM